MEKISSGLEKLYPKQGGAELPLCPDFPPASEVMLAETGTRHRCARLVKIWAEQQLRPTLMAVIFLIAPTLLDAQTAKPAPGLSAIFTSEKSSDVTSVPNVWLYVPSGQSPTPFLPAGKFTTTWNGFISVDLRGDYMFQAELNGSLKLEINGQTVLETSTNGLSEPSKSVRLSKGGTNVIVATFTSPAQGDAFLRLNWQPKDSFYQPIPLSVLTHAVTPEQQKSDQIRAGRELALEHRCFKCHVGPKTGVPELAMDAPSFEEIGTRRNYEWLSRWVLDPKALRAGTHMPKLLHGDKSKEDAEAIAAFLVSQKPTDFKSSSKELPKDQADAGKKLFDSLHCVACHNAPDASEADAKKISLKEVAAKFVPGTLDAFLKDPNAHYEWIRMPRFKLTDEQREQIGIYIFSSAEKPKEVTASTDKDVLDRGQKLVQTTGCLNCHNLKLENQFSTKAFAGIADWKQGCLCEKPSDKAPDFGFSAEEREAIQAFAGTDRASLERPVATDFAERHARKLNCVNCHGQMEGIPAFELLGGKLKPEWASKFIAGDVGYKARPWLEAQMPGFPKYAELMAKGLSQQNGFPPQTPVESACDEAAAKIGNNLVSNPPMGFSCVSCHGIGSVAPTQVFEAPGINLAHTGERLQPAFFKRWVRNPTLVDPLSKMPVYFDEQGKSPIGDVYDGDGGKQINALWHYVRLGDKMPPPKTQ